MSTFAERFKEQGMQQGVQQGVQQGEANVLLRLLERKYGSAAVAGYRERVQQADSETILKWSEHVLTADTIDEVFH